MELTQLTVAEAQQYLYRRSITPIDLAEAYLARIESPDHLYGAYLFMGTIRFILQLLNLLNFTEQDRHSISSNQKKAPGPPHVTLCDARSSPQNNQLQN